MMIRLLPIPPVGRLPDKQWQGKTIWLSGATGAWGQEICRQLLAVPIKKLMCFCRGEHRGYELARILNDPRVRIHLGDIRDRQRLLESLKDADYIIHAAALKRIDAYTFSPFEMVDVNVIGTRRVIETALQQHSWIQKAFYISSDKAALPTTMYGATKFAAEQLWLGANTYAPHPCFPFFSAARFGNALGSTGSVLQVWQGQIERNEPLTITDPDMTRFLITLPQAVHFLLHCIEEMKGNELWAPEMPSCGIGTLARAFAPDWPKVVVGPRGFGEKLHETLGEEGPSSQEKRSYDIGAIRALLQEGGIQIYV